MEQLKENLIEIITFNAKSAEERAAVIQIPEIRPATERRREMEEIKRGMVAPKEAQERRTGEIDSGNSTKNIQNCMANTSSTDGQRAGIWGR